MAVVHVRFTLFWDFYIPDMTEQNIWPKAVDEIKNKQGLMIRPVRVIIDFKNFW